MHNHKHRNWHKSKIGNSFTGACLQEKLAVPRGLDLVRARPPSDEAPQRGLPPVSGGDCRFRRRDLLLYDMHMQEFSCIRVCTQRCKAWLKEKGVAIATFTSTRFNFL